MTLGHLLDQPLPLLWSAQRRHVEHLAG
jgi:hypothetical protein